MIQRNPDTQPQEEVGKPNRRENQMSMMLNAARAMAGTDLPAEEAVPPGEQYLIFSLLDREFALPAECIQSVERLTDVTHVPNVASWVAGVINLRGSICSVVDLRAFLDMEQVPPTPRTRLLSVKYHEMVICLVVDGVSEMVPVQPEAIDSTTRAVPQWVAFYAAGIAAVGKRQVILLDAARLLFADKMHHYSA